MKTNINIDYESLVSQADLFYDRPVQEAYQGMPIGNGITGSMVWTESTKLKMQVNRVDVFATNGATTAGEPNMRSPRYLGANEYCGGCSFVDIEFGEEIFTSSHTRQHLSLYDATLNLKGKAVTADIKVWSEKDVFVVLISDEREVQKEVGIVLKMLRPNYVKTKEHEAISKLSNNRNTIVLSQVFQEKCNTGIKMNDHYSSSSVIAYADNCIVSSIEKTDDTITMKVIPQSPKYTINIGSGASFDSVEYAEHNARMALEDATYQGEEKITDSHLNWWHSYWKKSFIDTPCNPDYTLYWYTYLYYIGSTMRGDYPAKFNGLLFNCNGDVRSWGGQFWWYNQSRSHYGLDVSNHGDMNDAYMGMLLRNIDSYKTACEQQYGGNGGIYLPETEGFSGPEVLPENIANDLKNVLLYHKPATSELKEFMKDRSGLNSRWSLFYSPVEQEKDDYNSFHWHSNLSYDAGDAANTMWGHYLHTRDNEILKEIYPWLKGVAEFYRFHPCMKIEEDGKYHFYNLGWAESITSAKDVIDDLVIMKGIYKTVIKASEILGVDEGLRFIWAEFDSKTPDYPTSDMEDSIGNKHHAKGCTTYSIARTPTVGYFSDGNCNDCRLRMLFAFDLVNLETKESNYKEWEIAGNSFESIPIGRKLQNGELASDTGYVWNRGLVKAARLGRTDIVRAGLPAQLEQFKEPNYSTGDKYSYPNRMPWTNGEESYSIQELGVFSDQLQEPLLQSIANGAGSIDHVIHVFPAWPMEWDASFELHAKGGFLVHSSIKNKEIEYVRITSCAGTLCRLHNPWGTDGIEIWKDEKLFGISNEKTIIFDTKKNEIYIIIKSISNKTIEKTITMRTNII